MEVILDRYEQIVQQTKADLAAYVLPEKPGLAERVKRFFGKKPPEKDIVNWPAGLLLLGLWEAGEDDTVIAYMEEWIRGGCILRRADDALAGYVLLLMYETYRKEAYDAAARKIFAMLKDAPRDAEGGLIYNPAAGNEAVFADGTGMAVMFLAKYSVLFGSMEAAKEARKLLSCYRLHGMDGKTGLPYHGYILRENRRCGLVGWGRAVGWLLMGAAVYVKEIGEADAETAAFYETMCGAAEAFRTPGGLYPWQLAAGQQATDTSATAMTEYAMLLGEYRKAQDPETADTFGALWDSAPEGIVTGALAECLDFGNHPQKYGHYPWGQGAVLALLSLVRRSQHR